MTGLDQALVSAFLENVPDLVYFKDRASRFIAVSRSMVLRRGLESARDLIGKRDADFFSEESARKARQVEEHIMATGVSVLNNLEQQIWQDGRVTWTVTNKMPLRDDQGTVIGTFGLSKDVTKEKEMEAALAAEKERLAVTLGSMSEGVITIDDRGRALFVNKAAAELMQRRAEDAVGLPVTDLCVLRDSVSGVETALPIRDVLDRGVPAEVPASTLLTGRSDRQRLVEGRLVPIADVSSRRVGAVLVLRDITERRRMEEKLQNAAKMESVGLLAGGIAHDFNNILTAVLANLTLLQLDFTGTTEHAAVLDDAVRATKRAASLTLQLLTFAKGGDPVQTAVQLLDVIKESATFSNRGSGVRSEFEFAPDLWAANADKAQIGQVIQNLVINATQAMPNGGIIRIAASNEHIPADGHPVLAEGDFVRITVTDTGSGIAPESIGKIFDPYFTTKQPGHGLGLATVFSIIKRHQGYIDVSSTVGKGTTFTCWLPAARSYEAGQAEHIGFAGAERAGRVLFMDDDEPILKTAEKLMHRMGLEFESTMDGKAAIEHYLRAKEAGRPFDVVVMDLTIPGGMGGREAISVLCKHDPEVKAIVSSGYSSDLAMTDFRKCGFRAILAKPYDASELAAVIRQVLAEA